MERQIRWIAFILTLFLSFLEINSKELRVVCYYTNWSIYRPGSAKFSPQNINPYLCTHLIYAFGGFTKENTLKPFDKYQDIEKGGYAKFTGLKTYNKDLKTMLAIGGWNEGSTRFSPMVASAERRKELTKNVVKFLRQNHFDGLDLDWEYPSFRDGGKARDKDNYAQLVQELREEFDRESKKTGRSRLLLTMAVPAGIEYIKKGYDVPKLMKYLDWMNILSYDYHSAFEPSVNHHAPLYPLEEDNEYNYDAELNIDYTIKHYLEAGAISNKLVLGIPTYGRSYTLFNPDATDIGAPADGPGEMGDATRENGYLAYYEICEAVNSGEWTVVDPNEDAMGPYAYKDNQWVGYDDENIVRKKAQYVAEKDLGGIMFWSIDNDDFRGSCHNKSYPIIEAAKETLISSLGLGEGNVIKKSTKNVKQRGRLRNKSRSESQIDRSKTEGDDQIRNSGGRQSGSSGSKQSRVVTTERSQKGTKRRRPTSRRRPTYDSDEPVSESGSSLVVNTPKYTTPAPPTTPDSAGGEFKCEDEGFYPHPRDCKKYFWCLSGPSELGIIAHQFTCPAGLYFNKAASSCDYTQNVLCNKKKSTTTTTTTTTTAKTPTTTTALKADTFSTRRPPPKITAATSRTTFVSTTEAPEYEEYEYDDEEPQGVNEHDSEAEDPQVIKELLELIKKAGGIEELEKQLNIKDGSTAQAVDQTTPNSLSKKLYQRVLAKTKLLDSTKSDSLRNRNSRGPQNAGIATASESSKSAFRPKYSTISRTRTAKPVEPEEAEDISDENPEEKEQSTQGRNKQYVTLRRNRFSTTENPGQNKEEDYEEEEEDEVIIKPKISSTSPKSHYVTLRRSRPTTTTSGNQLVRNDSEKAVTDNPHVSSTSEEQTVSTEHSTSKYKEIRRDSTTTTTSTTEAEVITDTLSHDSLSSTSPPLIRVTNSLNNSADQLDTKNLTTQSITSTTHKNEIIEPQLLEPRPFSVNNNVRSTTAKTTSPTVEEIKVSHKSLKIRPVEASSSVNVDVVDSTVVKSRGRTRGSSRFNHANDNTNVGDTIKSASTDTGDFDSDNKRSRGRGRQRYTKASKPTTAINAVNTSNILDEVTIAPLRSTTKDTTKLGRKILRRLRPTTPISDGLLSTPIPYRRRLESNYLESTSNDDDDDENIKLSETIISESNDFNRVNSNSIVDGNRKSIAKVLKRVRTTTPSITTLSRKGYDKPLTEPNIIVRTRKIVRKLNATTVSSTEPYHDVTTEPNRRRKVIRRLRPTFLASTTSSTTEALLEKQNLTKDAITEFLEESITTIQPERDINTENDDIITTTDSEILTTELETNEETNLNTSTPPSTSSSTSSHKIFKSAEYRPKLDLRSRFATARNEAPTTALPRSRKPYRIRGRTSTTEAIVLEPDDDIYDDQESLKSTKVSPSFHGSGRPSTKPDFVETQGIRTTKPISTYLRVYTTRKPYRLSTSTENAKEEDVETEKPISDEIEEEEENNPKEEKLTTEPESFPTGTTKKINKPIDTSKYRTTKRFSTTTTSTVSSDLGDVDIEALSQRNKELFSRGRKMNTPYVSSTTIKQPIPDETDKYQVDAVDSTTELDKNEMSTNKFVQDQTTYQINSESKQTEKPTTLYHIFAETEPTTTDDIDDANKIDSNSGEKAFEKLIEVNRIVEINSGNKSNNSILDHIGVINRVTNIEVVNGDESNNETQVSDETKIRQERKFEILGDSKVVNFGHEKPEIINAKHVEIIPNQVLIESKSNVRTITPRPFYVSEASTIALEGLFRTEASKADDELLETQHSKHLNIKLLEQDSFRNEKAIFDYKAKFVPIKILHDNSGEVTMKAQVVEVTGDKDKLIKIAPIAINANMKKS